jgi:hypothetical protein
VTRIDAGLEMKLNELVMMSPSGLMITLVVGPVPVRRSPTISRPPRFRCGRRTGCEGCGLAEGLLSAADGLRANDEREPRGVESDQ